MQIFECREHTKRHIEWLRLTERAEFFIALTAMVIGTQLFLAGFLGEILVRSRKNEARYTISEELNLAQGEEQYSS